MIAKPAKNPVAAHAVLVPPAEISLSPLALSNAHRGDAEIHRLYKALQTATPERYPRTARLLASSTRKVAQKVIEEAGEVALEAVKRRNQGVVRESADLLYHLTVLWRRAGIAPDDIWAEMRRRADALGIAEKIPKPRSHLETKRAQQKAASAG